MESEKFRGRPDRPNIRLPEQDTKSPPLLYKPLEL